MILKPETDSFGLPCLTVENGDKSFSCDLSTTVKKNFTPGDLFDHINVYLTTLDDTDINRYYRNANRVNQELAGKVYSKEDVLLLKECMSASIKSLQWKKFLEWFKTTIDGVYSPILGEALKVLPIPDRVFDTFVYNADNGETANKTYVKEQLVEMVGLILFIRALLPLYNDYMFHVSKTNLHPSSKVFELFIGSDIDTDKGPLAKLREYTQTNYDSLHGNKDGRNRVITAGLSDDDVNDDLVAQTIFDKLLLLDFYSGKANAIKYTYQTIFRQGEYRKNGNYDLKLTSSDSKSEDDEYAYFENFRKTTDLSPGTLEELRFALSSDTNILRGLGIDPSTYDWDMYRSEIANIGVYMDTPVEPIKIYLLSWLLNSNIHPKAIFLLENRRTVELLLLSKVLLLQNNQPYIASVFSSIHNPNANFINVGVTVRNNLSKAVSERLAKLYRFYIDDRGPTYEKPILDFSKQLVNKTWDVHGFTPQEFVNSKGYLNTPNNVSDLLVDYVEFIISLKKRLKA